MTAAAPLADVERQEKRVEEKLIVLSGDERCPSRALCDYRKGETYDNYIVRHCLDHHLGEFKHFEDAERNLFLNCFYAFHKYCIGNPTLSPDPFWERHVFMVDWTLSQADLEQGIDRSERIYRLPDYDKMSDDRVEKRFKKIEAPRGTEKTAMGRAYATYRLLRAYFVEENPYYRVLAISATSRTARNQWFKPLKTLWRVNQNLKRLFGAFEFTCADCGVRQTTARRLYPGRHKCPNCGEKLAPRVRVREIALTVKGSVGVDNIQLRWTVLASSDFSGMAVENFQYLGLDSEITGQRFDLGMCDDLSTGGKMGNSRTQASREGVKDAFAEVMRTLDQTSGQLILSCTRKHFDDLAGDIDKFDGPYFQDFHIMSRRASWRDPVSGVDHLYWPTDATGKSRLDERELRKLLRTMSERGFFAEYQNDPQDPAKATFRTDWFQPVRPEDVPPPVMWGLGEDLTPQQIKQLEESGISSLTSVVYVDAAGQEKQKARADDTAIVGVRFYRGTAYILLLRSFKGADSEEKKNIYESAVYLRPRRIRYELPAHSKGIENGFWNFCREKSTELSLTLGRPINVHLPMSFQPVTTTISKLERMTRTEPHFRNGRVKIVATPQCAPHEIAKFRDQHVALGVTDHDDYPDAFSGILEDFFVPSFEDAVAVATPQTGTQVNTRGNIEVPFGEIFRSMMDKKKSDKEMINWGRGGGEKPTPPPIVNFDDGTTG